MSKRANNTLRLTSKSSTYSFWIVNEVFFYGNVKAWDRESRPIDKDLPCYFNEEMIRFCLYLAMVISQVRSPKQQSMLAHHLLDTFKKPIISMTFEKNSTLPSTAWNLLKMINERQASIRSFRYYITSESSEFIPKILDECTEVVDYIRINANFPDDFNYTSPRPFIAEELHVGKTTNWMNLEDFMNCRRIELRPSKKSNRTPKYWNTFFRNWINSDARLEYLSCDKIKLSDFPLIVNELSDGGIQQKGTHIWIEVKRRDGSEFVIGRTWGFDNCMYIKTKKEHLETLI
uniref:FBA_2 domain-containing protein n=3 Tax=Caenorhabditis tropicalis TaxID=1561998 RepID=A0A1I7UTN1_9PELO